MDEIIETIKLDDSKDLPENYSGRVEYKNSTLEYYLNGFYYREGGNPAIIYHNGTKVYYVNGNDITEEVNNLLSGKTNISLYEKWDNNTRLTFG